ncbi:hypothetical protein OHA37_09260 [Streptomyces sp. NBC_00335]|uniref:hypothetical protein n=1 Tax=unclassified Streptomyces TaxID=2593676 RepID=UPI00225AABF7|nr:MULTISPECIES: hypothetical protein [unclassified Streptomyces]MCX5404071.1 hypothetical protein [Streptomyces sp. NBC_00086]
MTFYIQNISTGLVLDVQKGRALVEELTTREDVPADVRERAAEFKPALELIESSLTAGVPGGTAAVKP